MARMIPEKISDHVRSRAERKLFDRIQEELGPEWTVLHSLGVAHHSSKPWAEIDFVLIGPFGIICLEVKGGRVRREHGEWTFVDATGTEHRKAEGPFEQVASASTALYKWLRSHLGRDGAPTVTYAVATPDITWNIDGPDIETSLVYDERDLDAPFSRFVDRVIERWSQTRAQRTAHTLDRAEIESVVYALRGDFDLRPSLRARIRSTTDELLTLTQEQYRILDGLEENDRVVVRGGAGTGKTLLAIEEARCNIAKGRRVALICSSELLGRHLANAAEGCVYVGHLHGLMRELIDRANRMALLPKVSKSDLFSVFYPEQSIEALVDLEELGSIEVLVVDEAQDLLLDSYLDFFDAILDGGLSRGSWRFFLDPHQNIFNVMDVPGLRRVLNHVPAQFRLSVNCRNTQQIAVHTSLLSDTDLAPVLRVEGEPVEQLWYEDDADLKRQLSRAINRILGGGVSPENIVILGPMRLEGSPLAHGLGDVPFPITEAANGRGEIAYSTIARFKGLEADVVLMFVDKSPLSPEARSNLYVATSRSRALLVCLLPKSVIDEYQELARRLGDRLKTYTTM